MKNVFEKSKSIKWLLISVTIFLVVIILLSAVVWLYDVRYQDRIFPGIQVAGINMGDKNIEQARVLLQAKIDNLSDAGIVFSYDNKNYKLLPLVAIDKESSQVYELWNYDVNKIVTKAYYLGRRGNFLQKNIDRLMFLLMNKKVMINYKLNADKINQIIKNKFIEYEKPGKDADLVWKKNKIMISENLNKWISKVCLWCGEPTGEGGKEIEKKGEHIFPESIGGKTYLPKGSVCLECNNKLSKYDRALRYGHPAMMNAYQVDPNITGKKKSGKKKEKIRKRREKEKNVRIEGEGGKLVYNNTEKTERSFIDADFLSTNENFIRGLHKCIANLLCENMGSENVRRNYPELINFVKNGGELRPWSYALSIPNIFKSPLINVPRVLTLAVDENDIPKVYSFIHSSGIWIVGAKHFALNPTVINNFSNRIMENISWQKILLENAYGARLSVLNKRLGIGDLNFYWAITEIQGKPENDILYLLTKCSTCGQTNPTGITYSRDLLYNGDRNKGVVYPVNSWNNYTKEDMLKFGIEIDKWDEEDIERYLSQAITVPKENDVRNRSKQNCKTNCINCGYVINFNTEDCFI